MAACRRLLQRRNTRCFLFCVCVVFFVGFFVSFQTTCISPDTSHTPTTVETLVKYVNTCTFNVDGPPGPGAKGRGVRKNIRLPMERRRRLDQDLKFHGFDTLISDVVNLNRKLPDLRSDACKNIVYPTNLPKASVVIIFRDEWPSVLLRTIYSILGNTPPNLIEEIVLVDDGSEDVDLIAKIDLHVLNLDKVHLVRHESSLGLMVARDTGIKSTRSEYFIVADSHIEVSTGWLEPILHRLLENPKVVLSSNVGIIKGQTFEYQNDRPPTHAFPFFDPLTLDESWVPYSMEFKKDHQDTAQPIPYGIVQGMIIGMTKDFYEKLGGFDTGMKIWGSEQLEISIKAWMCGGRVEMLPCSKVGHLYRQTPWTRRNQSSKYVIVNKARLISVWMDPPYTDYITGFIKYHLKHTGNVSDRQAIRTLNRCKPYSHFVDIVKSFSDVYFPMYPKFYGSVYNQYHKMCLDLLPILENGKETNKKVKKVALTPCHRRNGHQYFLLSEYDELRSIHCFVVKHTESAGNDDSHDRLQALQMSYVSTDQWLRWRVEANGYIVHIKTRLCLTAISPKEVQLDTCIGIAAQKWKWK